MLKIWGGNLDSLSFYDGGPAACLETVSSFSEAKKAVSEWHSKNYAAWVQNDKGEIIKLD